MQTKTPVLALAALALLAAPALADVAYFLNGTMPTSWGDSGAVWTGQYAFLFGGWTGQTQLDKIYRYNPATDTVTTMNARLPTPRDLVSAVWTGQYAFLFGGTDSSVHYDQILRYNPSTDTLTVMNARLPQASFGTAAVWTGQYAYVFGGGVGPNRLSSILRYDPATDTLTTMSAILPAPRADMSAAWDGTYAYVFGGNGYGYLDDIVRYHPATNTATTLSTHLPAAYCCTTAVWHDGVGEIIGGTTATGTRVDEILRFDPSASTLTLREARLPWQPLRPVAVWDGSSALIFGGTSSGIMRFHPLLSPAPRNLQVFAGPAGGQLSLEWIPPAHDDGPTGYRVYRSTSAAGPFTAIATTSGTGTSYTDSGLGNGATRYYKVATLNAAGEGPLTASASGTTATPPSAPATPAVTAGPQRGELTVTWQPPANNGGLALTGYKLYVATSAGGPYSLLASPGSTSYTHAGLADGATRYYRVSAVNPAGDSPQSGTASATTWTGPGAPGGVTATSGPGLQQIRLQWTAASDGGNEIWSYTVYRDDGTGFQQRATFGPSGRQLTDSNLDLTKTYRYYVTATNLLSEGPASAMVCARPYPVGAALAC